MQGALSSSRRELARAGPRRSPGLQPEGGEARAMRKVKAGEAGGLQPGRAGCRRAAGRPMQQAVMQKTVASALQTSSKGLKAEEACSRPRAWSRRRGRATWASTCRRSWASGPGGHRDDDEELLAELDALILGDAPTPPDENDDHEVEAAEAAAARDAAAIGPRRRVARRRGDAPRALPAAPKTKRKVGRPRFAAVRGAACGHCEGARSVRYAHPHPALLPPPPFSRARRLTARSRRRPSRRPPPLWPASSSSSILR